MIIGDFVTLEGFQEEMLGNNKSEMKGAFCRSFMISQLLGNIKNTLAQFFAYAFLTAERLEYGYLGNAQLIGDILHGGFA